MSHTLRLKDVYGMLPISGTAHSGAPLIGSLRNESPKNAFLPRLDWHFSSSRFAGCFYAVIAQLAERRPFKAGQRW